MNTSRHDTLITVADACADDAEVMALSVVRMIAAGYSTGDVACWDMAYAGAERTLRPESAGRLVASLVTLVRSVRAERRDEWQFMPVTCCRVTADEHRMLRLMAAARGRDRGAIALAIRAMLGTDVSPRLQTAAGIVARVLDEVSDELVAGAPRRPAASVH